MTVEEQVATLRLVEIAALLVENADLKRQVAWFKRQLFGQNSERRLREPAHRNRQSLSAARAVV